MRDVHSKLDTLLSRIPPNFQNPAPQPYAPVMTPPPPLYTLHSSSTLSESAATTPPQPLPSIPTNTHQHMAGDNSKTRTLQLGNGHSITFTAQDVPPPPTTTFTDNIPRLNSMWDDTSMYWDRDSVLKILGHPIALIYWPIVYTRWRAGDWDTLKTQFGHWKVCLPTASPFISGC